MRFDPTNQPGNETQCIQHVKALLDDAGIQNQVLANTPNRPNLIASLPGDGSASPLLLQGYVDVVPSDPAGAAIWQQPPFIGNLVDGYILGRGSLDMKGAIAMIVSAMLRAESEGMISVGDIVLTLVSDEEFGGNQGTRYPVEQHPEQFQGIKYEIGEFGGFSFNMGSRRFYPIIVAEKQVSHIRVTFRGPGCHASLANKTTLQTRWPRSYSLSSLDNSPPTSLQKPG